MGMPIDHAALLRQHDFVVPAGSGLDESERRLLLRYGRWLDALSSGLLQPLTPEQEHFVRVAHGTDAPGTEFERAWVKFEQSRSHAARAGGQDSPPVGPLEVAGRCTQLAAARRDAAAVHAEYQQRREAVLELVRSQLEALDAEFAERRRTADEEVRRLEGEVKELVLHFGQTVKHEGIHAVYARGRVLWDNGGLSRYAEAHPELLEFRKVGAPSVSLRYGAGEQGPPAATSDPR
jgi:hypothetical protein